MLYMLYILGDESRASFSTDEECGLGSGESNMLICN